MAQIFPPSRKTVTVDCGIPPFEDIAIPYNCLLSLTIDRRANSVIIDCRERRRARDPSPKTPIGSKTESIANLRRRRRLPMFALFAGFLTSLYRRWSRVSRRYWVFLSKKRGNPLAIYYNRLTATLSHRHCCCSHIILSRAI